MLSSSSHSLSEISSERENEKLLKKRKKNKIKVSKYRAKKALAINKSFDLTVDNNFQNSNKLMNPINNQIEAALSELQELLKLNKTM